MTTLGLVLQDRLQTIWKTTADRFGLIPVVTERSHWNMVRKGRENIIA